MKKLFLFLLVASFAIGANAQVGTLKSVYILNSDTVTNTGTKYLYLASPISGYQKAVSVNVNLTKISGTVAGSVTLEASLDGVNYYNAFLGTDSTYSFSPTDVASQSYRFKLNDFRDRFLRVKYTGAGTMSAIIAGKYLY